MTWLETQGISVFGVDKHVEKTTAQTWPIDVQEGDALKAVLDQCTPDVIFLLTGAAGLADEAALWSSHVAATRAVLVAAQATSPKARIVILGSAAEYGSQVNTSTPISEAQSAIPDTAYGKAKLAQSTLAQELGLQLGLDVVRVRLFNTLGPGQGQHLVGGAMVKRLHDVLMKGEKFFKVYDPASARDYLDVRDVVRLLWLIATEAKATLQQPPIQIASGKAVRVLELARHLLEVAEAGTRIEIEPIQTSTPTCYVGTLTTLRQLLDQRPIQQISVRDSLHDMWLWQINNHSVGHPQ
jgi:nucleoside-diphosphate-sugar epimerase